MKLFVMLFLSLMLGKSCDSESKNDLKNAILVYTASTRGFYQKISIQDQKVSVTNDRSGNATPEVTSISDADWKELVGYFESINLDSLVTLKAPTEKRFHDGAAIANLQVTYKGKDYNTSAFDHGFPPEPIAALVTKINSFAKKQK